jgi:uncharacterized protein
MSITLALAGIRVHLSGTVPDNQLENASKFIETLTLRIFSEGGTVVHGSHPSLNIPLEKAARYFINAGGHIGALTFVRAQKYALSPEHQEEIEYQKQYSTVQIVPASQDDDSLDLTPMRDWMAETSDVIVAFGGNWWDINKAKAGVPNELEAMLDRGKPGFIVGGFGGAIAGYLKENPGTLSRLKNGLPESVNHIIAHSTSIDEIIESIVNQIKLLPLVRKTLSKGRNFRILALDGGGLRGAFTAAVLAKWDDMLQAGGGNSLISNFDLVAGTSTGAILAIGLALGLSPLQILNFYKDEGPNIFPQDRKLRHWLTSKHKSSTLRDLLTKIYGSKKLSEDSCCRLVIPTVKAIHGQAEAIVTPHSPDRTAYRDLSAVDAALASSAAPTYFDPSVWDGPIATETFLDGGVWANNPILPALAEAVRHLKIPIDRIDVLSVGTLGCENNFTESLGKGKLGWAADSADLFFAAQEHGSLLLAEGFLGPTRHLRVNQQIPMEILLDDSKGIDDLITRGNEIGQNTFIHVRSRFLDGNFAENWQRF